MISVLIPAYNEEKTISKLLKEYEGLENLYEVIVITNGCSDNTMTEAKKFKFVKIINLSIGSKVIAINEGIKLISGDRVMIQDADVIIKHESLVNLSNDKNSKEYDFFTLEPKFIGGSFLVRKFYKFMMLTPVFKKGMVSAGVYIISNKVIDKVFPLPNVISDDGFVKSSLGENNLFKIKNSFSNVLIPNDLYSLVKIKTRSRMGNLQLKHIFGFSPSVKGNEQKKLFLLAVNNKEFFSYFIYVLVTIVCRARAFIFIKLSKDDIWERDDSNR
ncbi:glycosyltransferase [Shewanella sp. 5S214]|uniref:glycosyltransferase n=1 Tax=Shewanella sp. 5S214 TaxID=3229999 RepID=UPI00352C4AEC